MFNKARGRYRDGRRGGTSFGRMDDTGRESRHLTSVRRQVLRVSMVADFKSEYTTRELTATATAWGRSEQNEKEEGEELLPIVLQA